MSAKSITSLEVPRCMRSRRDLTLFRPDWRGNDSELSQYAERREGNENYPDLFLGYDIHPCPDSGDVIIVEQKKRKFPHRLANVPMSLVAITFHPSDWGAAKDGVYFMDLDLSADVTRANGYIYVQLEGSNLSTQASLDRLNWWIKEIQDGRAVPTL